MDEKQRYKAGMKVRREVLGDTHVDYSLEKLTPFNGEFQEIITRHAWGDIWTRPGLPRHTRSLITIAMLIGMNREGELRLHLRAAKNPRRDQGSADAERDLLRHSSGQRHVPSGRRGLGRDGGGVVNKFEPRINQVNVAFMGACGCDFMTSDETDVC